MNEIEVIKTFEEKIADQLKDIIGSLMTPEDLKPLVEKSVHETFFKPRKILERTRSWDTNLTEKTKECLMSELVRNIMEEQVKEAMKEHMSENAELYTNAIRDIIQRDTNEMVMKQLAEMFTRPMDAYKFAVGTCISDMTGQFVDPFNPKLTPQYLG